MKKQAQYMPNLFEPQTPSSEAAPREEPRVAAIKDPCPRCGARSAVTKRNALETGGTHYCLGGCLSEDRTDAFYFTPKVESFDEAAARETAKAEAKKIVAGEESVDVSLTELIFPYYEHNGIQIFNANCRDILPQIGRVDLMITDPPYGMEFISNHRIQKHSAIKEDDAFPKYAVEEAIFSARFASYVFCRWDMLHYLPGNPTSVIAWVKNNHSMGDLKHEHGRMWEAIAFYPMAQHEFIKRIPDVIKADRTGNNLHPSEKPVALLKKLIECNKGDVILDPFMGSGTTLVAAQAAGRKAIGIEVERKYCDVAIERLKQKNLF
jgi:site-specific DNA-methyltransferase (adenine-specific)